MNEEEKVNKPRFVVGDVSVAEDIIQTEVKELEEMKTDIQEKKKIKEVK